MKTKLLPIMSVVILWTAVPLQAVPQDKIFTSSGQILPGEEWSNVYIYNDDTIVDMLGGLVDGIGTYDASTVNLIDGYISTLDALEFSTANVSGGSVRGLHARDRAAVNVFDSAEVFSLTSRGDFSVVDIFGGTLDHASALGSGILNISGGVVSGGIGADYSGTLNMTGGATQSANFRGQATANLYNGTISDFLMATEASIVNVYGRELVKTSSGGSYGYGQVYGFWLDDTAFTIDLNGAETYSRINLIPEPSSLVLLALGGLFLKGKRQFYIKRV